MSAILFLVLFPGRRQTIRAYLPNHPFYTCHSKGSHVSLRGLFRLTPVKGSLGSSYQSQSTRRRRRRKKALPKGKCKWKKFETQIVAFAVSLRATWVPCCPGGECA